MDTFWQRARVSIVEPWSTIPSICLAVEGGLGPGSAVSPVSPELVTLQERVRDLKAELSNESGDAASNLLTAFSRSGRTVTLMSQFFAKTPLPSARTVSRREGRSGGAGCAVRAGARRDFQVPGKLGGGPQHQRLCAHDAHLKSISYRRHSLKDVGAKTAREMRTLALAMAALSCNASRRSSSPSIARTGRSHVIWSWRCVRRVGQPGRDRGSGAASSPLAPAQQGHQTGNWHQGPQGGGSGRSPPVLRPRPPVEQPAPASAENLPRSKRRTRSRQRARTGSDSPGNGSVRIDEGGRAGQRGKERAGNAGPYLAVPSWRSTQAGARPRRPSSTSRR